MRKNKFITSYGRAFKAHTGYFRFSFDQIGRKVAMRLLKRSTKTNKAWSQRSSYDLLGL